MLLALGFGAVGYEIVWAVVLSLLALAVLVGWSADFILGDLGFGLLGNALVAFAGSFAGLLLFVRYPLEWLGRDEVSMSAACVAGAFGGILCVGLLRRAAT
jgi:hypothetical protein